MTIPPKSSQSDDVVIASVQQEVAGRPHLEQTKFNLPILSPPDPRIRPLNSPPTTYDH